MVPKLKTYEIILIHPRFGRRKSWLVPAQLCIGCLVCSSLSASLYKYNIHPVHCRCYIIAMYLINNDSIATFTTKSSWDFYVCLKLSSSLDHESGKKLSVRFAHWLYLFIAFSSCSPYLASDWWQKINILESRVQPAPL